MIKDKIDYGILIKRLNDAANAYYNSGTPIMTDEEFDFGIAQLREFEEHTGIIFLNSPTQTVGATVLNELKKVDITPKPMLSLEKCHTVDEIKSFIGKENFIAMVKLDGLSIRIKYKDGELYAANTRGNGSVGSDITEHVKQFINVPKRIPIQQEYIIDGEAIIKRKDFEIINQNNEFKNPRNAAAGTLNLLDTKIVKSRRLSFIAWDVIEGYSTDFNYLSDKLEEAHQYGFEIVPYRLEGIIGIVNHVLMGYKEEYPCDGVVWKYDNFIYGDLLGATGHHFKNAIAWKPEVEVVESTLKSIDWTMGRTGVLTPVAIFNPVELDGSTIERASLHNINVMNETLHGSGWVGQKLKIYKANLIIPQILSAEEDNEEPKERIQQPWICPICGEPLYEHGTDSIFLVCENPNCDGKLINRLDHFCGKKGLDIKGLSKATLEKLIAWEWVSNFSDIYQLEQYRITWTDIEGFGDKSVRAILTAIEESKNTTLEKFISAIGIPLIGNSVAKEICKHVSTYEEFRRLVDEKFDFSKWDTFGPEKCASIWNYDFTEADNVSKYLTLTYVEQPKVSGDLNVVITGKLTQYKNRAALQKAIEAIGGKVSSSISSKTNYLINNDIDSMSTKNLEAKKLGIPIISEQEFIEKFLL